MRNQHPLPILHGVKDLMARTGLGRTTIYSEIKAGRLQKTKIGRRTVFTNSAVLAWIKQRPNASDLPQFKGVVFG